MNVHAHPWAAPLALLVILGCGVWLATLVALWRTRAAVPMLRDQPFLPPLREPTVSLLVPARNEALTLPAAADTWRALDEPRPQIVLVDDRSDDGTGEIVDRLAQRDPRIVPVHVTDLPPGWLGKNHALQRAVEASTGEWLLFTDADVHFAPDAVRRAVAHAELHGLDQLAVLPDVVGGGPLYSCALAHFARSFTLSQRLWDVSNPRSSAHVGVGAFNLVRRAALERTPGLPWLALDVADDVALGKLLKSHGCRCGVAGGMGLVSVAWYPSFAAMARGLEKNTFSVLRCNLGIVLIMVAFSLGVDFAPLLALLPWGVPWMAPLGALAVAAALVSGASIALRGRRPLLPALLWPVGSLLFAYVLLRAGILGHRRGGIAWRGTFHSSAELRKGARVTFP
ncbi:MAG: glycosyltransferase [Planctomycetes bacterium]|nr:glycosyltransferase [Planctomycetota bacterium]